MERKRIAIGVSEFSIFVAPIKRQFADKIALRCLAAKGCSTVDLQEEVFREMLHYHPESADQSAVRFTEDSQLDGARGDTIIAAQVIADLA